LILLSLNLLRSFAFKKIVLLSKHSESKIAIVSRE
jgi:hypothetical protein